MSNTKRSILSFDKMVALYLEHGAEQDTWDMLDKMARHGLISKKTWRKFVKTCKDWSKSEDEFGSGYCIVNHLTCEILYYFNDNGDLVKAEAAKKKKPRKYRVTYKEKDYIYKADNASDALERFTQRKAWGTYFIWNWRLLMVDADTWGKEWAQGITGDGFLIFAEVIKPPEEEDE